VNPLSATFEYHREVPPQWSATLHGLKKQGVENLILPVDWSVHEPVKGIRDFSRSSKLRIERVLSCAEEAGLTVTATTGFRDFLRATPMWARSTWENAALLPSTLVYRRPLGAELTTVSSLFDIEFKSAWFDFLQEMLSILSLYAQPEGPLSSVEIDLSLFETDQGMLRAQRFPEILARRYGAIDQLNLRYQSSFRTFESACSPQGYRLLMDKRPWHAVYDYRWCRRELLRELSLEVLNLPICLTDGLKNRVRVRTSAPTSFIQTESDLSVAVDSVFIEQISDVKRSPFDTTAFPCSPDGLVHAQAAIALRIWEALSHSGFESDVPVYLMPVDSVPSGLLKTSVQVVICGRYLCRNWAGALAEYVHQGGHAIFPFGLPQYDECLKALSWKGTPGESVIVDESRVSRTDWGKGSYWVPSPAPVFGEDFFATIQELGQLVIRTRHH